MSGACLSLLACTDGGLSATWLSFRFFAGAGAGAGGSRGVVLEGLLVDVSVRFLVDRALPKSFGSRTGVSIVGVVVLLLDIACAAAAASLN